MAVTQDMRPILKDSRNDKRSDRQGRLFSFDGGEVWSNGRLISHESDKLREMRRLDQQEQVNPNNQEERYGEDIVLNQDSATKYKQDYDGAHTPVFPDKRLSMNDARNDPDYLAYQERLNQQLEQKQQLIQLDFTTKGNRTISPYFQNHIDFMSKKNKE